MPLPALVTFDIFGTVLDWRSGLERDCAAAGRAITATEFERIIDRQAALESGPFRPYGQILRASLVDVIDLNDRAAARIAGNAGCWPLFGDSRQAMHELVHRVPCAAITNSDRMHRDQVCEQLGCGQIDWLCAEDMGRYKPDPECWQQMSRCRGIPPGPAWWHVSAYADYDLAVANRLGLTTVFVARAHSRPGPATHTVRDLHELVSRVEAAGSD